MTATATAMVELLNPVGRHGVGAAFALYLVSVVALYWADTRGDM